jgi:hypothetical protein
MTIYNIPTNIWKALAQTRAKIKYMSAQGIDTNGEKEIFKILVKDHANVIE